MNNNRGGSLEAVDDSGVRDLETVDDSDGGGDLDTVDRMGDHKLAPRSNIT